MTRTKHLTRASVTLVALIAGFLGATAYGRHASDMEFALMFGVFLWFAHQLDEPYRQQLLSPRALIRIPLGWCKLLGLMSYSLYLLHGRLQFLAAVPVRQLTSGIPLDLAVIAVTCLMSYVFYRYFEIPFILSRASTLPAAPMAAVVAIS